MMKIKIIFIAFLVFMVGCSQQPDIDISKALGNSEDYFRELKEIETTASAYDGKKDIKFRLMVEGTPTEEEATDLFNQVLESIKENTKHQDIWEYYDGYFDIKNYDDGVIYEASKFIGEELKVVSK